MMNKKTFLLLQFTIMIYSLSSVFSKYASGAPFLSLRYVFFIGLVVCCLGIYALLWQQVLKKAELSAAYANKGVSLIWNMLFGYFIFAEKISIQNVIGALIVLTGIAVMAIGGAKDE